MQHISSNFVTTDNLKIHTEAWLPSGTPRGVVLVVHGIAEHIGRYAHVAAFLVERGFAVYGLDHRGHGQSDGLRGYFDTFEDLINDLSQYLTLVRRVQAGQKLFIFGHSMGALITVAYVLRQPEDITGLVVSGIPLGIHEQAPAITVPLSRLLNHFVPTMPVTTIDITGMSRDPVVLASWTADPLVNLRFIRVRTTLGIIGIASHIRANLADVTLPILIIHGGADRIANAGGSQILYDGVQSASRTLRIYPELYHELVNEPERDMVLNDIVSWLDAH